MKLAILLLSLAFIVGCTMQTNEANKTIEKKETKEIKEEQDEKEDEEEPEDDDQEILTPAPSPIPQNQTRAITEAQLSSHNNMQDCWVAYDGKVYNLTSWLPRHPGSASAILPQCGTSTGFQTAFERQHGKTKVKFLMTVAEIMGEFKVVGKII